MRSLTKLFLLIFLAQGLSSFAAAALGIQPFLAVPLKLLGAVVVLAALALCLLMLFTPRIAKRLALIPALFVLWNGCGAFPLSLYLSDRTLGMVIGGVQALLVLTIYLTWGDRRDWCWTIFEVAQRRPAFTWKNLFGSGLGAGLFAVLIIGLWLHAAAFLVDSKTGGYVRVRPTGVTLEERRFQRADKEVRLIAMVHVARGDFYNQTERSLPRDAAAVVLTEGVTDHQKLLSNRFSYSPIAQKLGLTSQTDSEFQNQAVAALAPEDGAEPDPAGIKYRSGDIDISELQPKTLRLLEAMGKLLASVNFDQVIAELSDPRSPFNDQSSTDLFLTDILEKRNQHLLVEMQKALGTHQIVVVPWGAMHLAAIQKQIEAWGFVETHRSERKAL